MDIDFSQVLKNIDGTDLMDGVSQTTVTLGSVCMNALMAVYTNEQVSGEEKLRRYDLGIAIYAAKGPLELKAEVIALVKNLVAKGYGPLVVGQAWRMLDPAEGARKEK